MNQVASFLKRWQDVADGNTPAAQQFRSDPQNQRHLRLINWVVTAVACVGMLYIFLQPL